MSIFKIKKIVFAEKLFTKVLLNLFVVMFKKVCKKVFFFVI